jgi:cytochrome c oxidase subunit 2
VDIELRSADVIHSFWVPRLHGKVDLVPGQPNVIRIQADQVGEYRGQCGEYCGAQHAHMMLVVVAQTEADYNNWSALQRSASREPESVEQIRGRELFMTRPCALCHTIRGTVAFGNLGPDLTHLASRASVAANMLPNDEANLRAWVTHAQSLKEASLMPNVTQFTGNQLDALVAFLQALR